MDVKLKIIWKKWVLGLFFQVTLNQNVNKIFKLKLSGFRRLSDSDESIGVLGAMLDLSWAGVGLEEVREH